MPILAAEPDLLPADLFEAGIQGELITRRWWVAHTLPRQEKALARQLRRENIPYYLPCDPKRVRVRNRVEISQVPIFAGYLFVRAEEWERIRVLKTNRLAALLEVRDQERMWDDLRRVRRVLDLGQPVTVEHRLVPGMPVTIREGPLAGMTGTVVRNAGGFHFVVSVDFLQRGLSVTVEGGMLGVTSS
jgi:transcription antitermination factor NusG